MKLEFRQKILEALGIKEEDLDTPDFPRVDKDNWRVFWMLHDIRDFRFEEFIRRQADMEEGYMDGRVIVRLQKMRDILGFPIVVSSGYRSEEWNRKIGGAKNSLHLVGKAVDVVFNNTKEKMALISVGALFFNGVIVYDKHIHFDLRSYPYISLGGKQD